MIRRQIKMKVDHVKIAMITEFNSRLDASYYSGTNLEVLRFIQFWTKDTKKKTAKSLSEITRGQIFMGPRLRRVYVTSREHGLPFLTPSDMVLSDFQRFNYVSRKFTKDLDALRLKKGWLLISRSGSIGNVVLATSDMEDMAGSDDIIRIITEEPTCKPGFLYAFLSSPIGQTLLRLNTYGGVIQHIEPHHLAKIPIPIVEQNLHDEVNSLIDHSSNLRVGAKDKIEIAKKKIENELGEFGFRYDHQHSFAVETAKSAFQYDRLDSFYYVGYCREAQDVVNRYDGEIKTAEQAGYRVWSPNIFKAVFAGTGYPYMSGVDLYQMKPTTSRYLSHKMPDVQQYVLQKGMVVVQTSGQRYGLIGTPLYVTDWLDGVAATSDVIRIEHASAVENGYFCGLLHSELGRRLALRVSYGSSIPHIDVNAFAKIRIPWLPQPIRHEIGKLILEAYEMRAEANRIEDQAQKILMQELGADEKLLDIEK